jgi:hypothetical protein
VPTVAVTADGVVVPTPAIAGDRILTVTWREVQVGLASAPVLVHAPWLRLLAPDAVTDPQVVLAVVTLDAVGAVTALGVGARRVAAVATGSVELRVARVDGDAVAGGLRARPGGGVALEAANGPITLGGLTVGQGADGGALDVPARMRVRRGGDQSAGMWLRQGEPDGDRAFVGMADDNRVGLWGNTGAGWGLTMDTTSGDVALTGSLNLPKTAAGTAAFTNATFQNENDFSANNLKLQMASSLTPLGLPIGPEFEFMVGYSRRQLTFPPRTRFVRVFGVDGRGNAFFSGGKGGYVVDYFVNAVGDALEQGDVVVLRPGAPVAHYGTGDAIPVPEVDLTDRPGDRRVCGIVCDAVGASGLPSLDPNSDPEEGEHPLARFRGEPDAPPTAVADGRMGRMVTLGAFAFCKVDADVAPIEVGDLLTTSATPGHAQKSLDPAAAVGAVLGKAMGPLASGRGVVPVLVSLQ